MNKSIGVINGVLITVLSAIAVTAPVSAQATSSISTTQNEQRLSREITIPVTEVVRGSVGSVTELANRSIENGEYTVKVVAKNQESVHPNTDIVVTSGDSTVVVEDVETEASADKVGVGNLTVANGEVTVSVRLGKDGVFSGGVDVILMPVVTKQPVEQSKPEPKVESKTDTKPEVPAEIPQTGTASIGLIVTAVASAVSYAAALRHRK